MSVKYYFGNLDSQKLQFCAPQSEDTHELLTSFYYQNNPVANLI